MRTRAVVSRRLPLPASRQKSWITRPVADYYGDVSPSPPEAEGQKHHQAFNSTATSLASYAAKFEPKNSESAPPTTCEIDRRL